MANLHGFELISERHIPELKTKALFYRHVKTGAQLLSLVNDDENKVFGVTLRTPPTDSTGAPHILEHSVLCGSDKYPVKEPFVELLKGSLKTFLNAFTYPDKTCYPVASQNLKDFYNLIDVYLDAVFHPRLTPFVFQQEGWHLEMHRDDPAPSYKGVVFNEMKGAYSAPDRLLVELSQQSLFPDNTYGLDSGGNPRRIPDLTFDDFMEFYRTHYHPSNARFYFYGDDDPEARLKIVNDVIEGYAEQRVDTTIPLQSSFSKARREEQGYASEAEQARTQKPMLTVNWLFPEVNDPELKFALYVLEYVLIGMPASPLRRALIESGLGEDMAGGGLETELRQMYFSTGMKGVTDDNLGKVEHLIHESLARLVRDGIDKETIEAALNTIEFQLRENNTGSFPRGLVLMLRALTNWLYDQDPIDVLTFDAPLKAVKDRIAAEPGYLESLIRRFLIDNPHRTTVVLKPDPELSERLRAEERARLDAAVGAMDEEGIEAAIRNTEELKRKQETPDSPEALSAIPTLQLEDLEPENRPIPCEIIDKSGAKLLWHDLFTNGIMYLDLGFDLHALPEHLLPYMPIFGRALLEMGTETEDYVSLTQRIRSKTGGIRSQVITGANREGKDTAAWLLLRSKAMYDRIHEQIEILGDILFRARLDNRARFLQIALEEKARYEHQVVPNGHRLVVLRLSSHFSEAGWLAEQLRGVSYLFFLRELIERIEKDWHSVQEDLEEVRRRLINRRGMILNVTADQDAHAESSDALDNLLGQLANGQELKREWERTETPGFEALIVPSQVGFVGKAANLYQMGYDFHGSSLVIGNYLRTSWLWDRVRVRGGAYGAFCLLDRFTGVLSFASYRDPNFLQTVEVFDKTADYLKNLDLHEDELRKSIIGVIGDLDSHMLPDAKGFASLSRYLTGDDEAGRQAMREQVLATGPEHFRDFAEVLMRFKDQGLVKVLASQALVDTARKTRGADWLTITRLL